MLININEIERITSLLLSKFREIKGDEVELNNDYYWDISDDELYNPYEIPKNITLGQLSFDLESIQRLKITNSDAISYDLIKVASILKALSIENSTAF